MPPLESPEPALWQRLRQRKLVTWTAAYVAGAFALLQAVALIAEQFNWPASVVRSLAILLLFGLPITVILAWHHGERGRQRATSTELITIAVIGVLGVVAAWRFGSAVDETARPEPAAGARAIAVLPFRDISPDRNQSYLSDGRTEELINALANVPGLRVASPRSSFSIRDSDRSMQEIARELHVGALLEGSIRKQGNKLRVTAKLVDGATGFHLWSESYDRELSDVFVLQEEIARRIAQRMHLDTAVASNARLATRHTSDMQAYELYLRGRALTRSAGQASLNLAIAQFNQAIALDPQFAAAYAALADAYLVLGFNYVEPRTVLPSFEENARRAVALDDGLAQAHIALAYAVIAARGDWSTGLHHASRATTLDPNNADLRAYRAVLLSYASDADAAMREINEAHRLEPSRTFTTIDRGLVLFFTRQFEQAEEHFKRVLQDLPDFPRAHLWLGWSYAARGQYDAAIEEYRKEKAVESTGQAYIAHAEGMRGKRRAARLIADDLARRAQTEFIDAHRVATAYLGARDRKETIRWLTRAFEQKSFHLMTLGTDPFMDPLRNDPEFAGLLRRAGFRR